jgi:beta-lactamase regulating signal transducer with metallopeptidase domain
MNDFLGQLDQWSAVWSQSLWRASLAGGVAIGLAWGISHGCRFLSARVRCWVWRLACVKLLVAFVWIQPLALAVLPAEPAPAHAVAARVVDPIAETRSQILHTHNSVTAAIPPIMWQPRDERPEISMASILMLLCVAYGIVRTGLRWRAIARLRARTVANTHADWLRDLRDEAERMAVRRLPQLCCSREAKNVQLVGIWRPAIVLPECSLDALSEEERRLVLAHELAHLKRHDLAWNWLATVAQWLFFFHPLVWILVRGWCRAQEAACDELVIRGLACRRAPYGRLLLKMSARWPDERQNVLVAAGISGSYRQLEQRILAMTRIKPHSRPKLAAAAAAVLAIVCGGVIPWRLVAQEPARPSVPNATGTGSTAGAQETNRLKPSATIRLPLNIAQAQNRTVTLTSSTSGVSADGTSSSSGSTSVILPGKLYLRTSVEFKTERGASGKYWGLIAVDPNSGEWERLDADGFNIKVSPQRDRLAFCQVSGLPDKNGRVAARVVVSDSGGRNLIEVAQEAILPIWSPDGKQLLFSRDKWKQEDHKGSAWLLTLADKQLKKLPIPETDEVDDWSRDGAWVVTVSNRQPPFGRGYQVYVMHPDGTHQQRITDGSGLNCNPRFRPGIDQVAYNHQGHGSDSLWLVNLDGTNRKQLLASDKNGAGAPGGACWSPDGAWLAVMRFDWRTDVPGILNPNHERMRVPGACHDRLEIIAADGTPLKVLALKDVTKVEFIENGDWR